MKQGSIVLSFLLSIFILYHCNTAIMEFRPSLENFGDLPSVTNFIINNKGITLGILGLLSLIVAALSLAPLNSKILSQSFTILCWTSAIWCGAIIFLILYLPILNIG